MTETAGGAAVLGGALAADSVGSWIFGFCALG